MAEDVIQSFVELQASVEGLCADRELAQRERPELYVKARAETARRLMPIASMHALHGEDRAEAVFDWLLAERIEPLASVIPDDVTAVKKQYRLADGKGRVDRAVFHRSGRVSLVEVKDAGSIRDIVAGIGQAAFYRALMERTTSFSPIVPVLAVLTEHDPDVARACQIAGVEYLPLGDLGYLRAFSKVCAHIAFS